MLWHIYLWSCFLPQAWEKLLQPCMGVSLSHDLAELQFLFYFTVCSPLACDFIVVLRFTASQLGFLLLPDGRKLYFPRRHCLAVDI